jgi:predicted glycogen debranching enzyme
MTMLAACSWRFANSIDRGMLPNRFPDAGETPEYNTVDATLWFFEAVRAFGAHTEDYEFIRTRLYPLLADIIAWHERGTRFGIRLDADGLLLAGEEGVQLTWRDAEGGDRVVNLAKPVEIQALWYNALRTMEDSAGASAMNRTPRITRNWLTLPDQGLPGSSGMNRRDASATW